MEDNQRSSRRPDRGIEDVAELICPPAKLLANCLVQAVMHVSRQFDRLRIAKNLDAFPGLVQDHGAIFAMGKVTLEFLLHGWIEFAVNIVRDLANDAFAIQFGTSRRK